MTTRQVLRVVITLDINNACLNLTGLCKKKERNVMIRNVLTNRIDKALMEIRDEKRDYIGASSIGHDCWRKIWYEFNGYEGLPIDPKIRRTFHIGHALEEKVKEWLKDAGIFVYNYLGPLKSESVPELSGHEDAVLRHTGTDYIVEVKTAKDSSYRTFVTKGLELWNPQYYYQLQTYMGMSEVYRSYIIVLNKDTSEISDEYVEFNKKDYEKMEEKARIIASAKTPPPKVNSSPIWYQCKMCKFNKECHE